jgi:hypothetical protein
VKRCDGSDRVRKFGFGRRDLKGQLVPADADPVAVSERGGTPDSLLSQLDSVSRPQIGDHPIGSGVDDDGVMPADAGVVLLQT